MTLATFPPISPLSPGFATALSPRIPPYFLNTDHRQRCLAQLRSKSTGLEKYIYLSGLKERDPNLFYEVLLGNMLEIIPILYTPTVRPFPSSLCSSISDMAFSRLAKRARVTRTYGAAQKASMCPLRTEDIFDKFFSLGLQDWHPESPSSPTVRFQCLSHGCVH
jgi:hypothetical protein